MTLRGLLALLCFLLTWPATAQTVQADPTLWHVKGPRGDAYLLGSIHILPPTVQWHAAKIDAAIAKSDVFVFEVPLDPQTGEKVKALVAANGYLPAGQTLRELLPEKYRADYDTAVTASGVDAAALSREKPWLAGLQMMFAEMARLNFDAGNGPDTVLMKQAADAHKDVRYLETIDEQFAVLAPSDADLDLQQFESSLKDLRDAGAEIQPLIDAWAAGDQSRLDTLVNGDLDQFPKARKMLLDDRNARWLPKITAMLNEKHTVFITVGAGHLTGRAGLPALLRKAGYRVEP